MARVLLILLVVALASFTCQGFVTTLHPIRTVNTRSAYKSMAPTSLRMSADKSSHTVTKQAVAPPNKLWNAYLKTTDTLTTLFPLWTVLFAGLALTKPESFAWFTTKYFTGFLGTMRFL
jgi:hypothetical protein